MPSLGDSAFIFVLALLLFGPKKLPELARQLGKLMGEFRRASNEFRMQMEDELRISEQAERQKEIAAIQAAAPVTPAIDPVETNSIAPPTFDPANPELAAHFPATPAEEIVDPLSDHPHMRPSAPEVVAEVAAEPEPHPIAASGSLQMRPPKTGMPFAQTMGTQPSRLPQTDTSASLSPLFNSIPHETPAEMPTADATAPIEASPHG